MTDCKRCGGDGKVGMAVANPFGSHDYKWYDCPECHPDGNTAIKAENTTLRDVIKELKHDLEEILELLGHTNCLEKAQDVAIRALKREVLK